MINWDLAEYKDFEVLECDKGTGYPKYYNSCIEVCDFKGREMTIEELEDMPDDWASDLVWDYFN
jgi:hypothetical protein